MSTELISLGVRFIGPLKAIAGRKEVSILLPAETRIAELAELLLQEFGEKAEVLVDPETREFRGQYRVVLNGKYVNAADGDQGFFQDGDTVSLLPVVGGGTG